MIPIQLDPHVFIIQFLDLFGVITGFLTLGIAAYALFARDGTNYDEPYIAALYMVGIILLFFAGERPLSHDLTGDNVLIVLGRAAMYVTVFVWEVLILRSFTGDE